MSERVIKQPLSAFEPKKKDDISEATIRDVTSILRNGKADNIHMVLVCRTDVGEFTAFGKAFEKIRQAVAEASKESPATEILFRNIVPAHAVGMSDIKIDDYKPKK